MLREKGRFVSKLEGTKAVACLRLRDETMAFLREESKRLGYSMSELVDVLVISQKKQETKPQENRNIVDQPKMKKYSI